MLPRPCVRFATHAIMQDRGFVGIECCHWVHSRQRSFVDRDLPGATRKTCPGANGTGFEKVPKRATWFAPSRGCNLNDSAVRATSFLRGSLSFGFAGG
jgi:hypothetical protein